MFSYISYKARSLSALELVFRYLFSLLHTYISQRLIIIQITRAHLTHPSRSSLLLLQYRVFLLEVSLHTHKPCGIHPSSSASLPSSPHPQQPKTAMNSRLTNLPPSQYVHLFPSLPTTPPPHRDAKSPHSTMHMKEPVTNPSPSPHSP